MFLKIILFMSLIVSASYAQRAWTPEFAKTVSDLNEKDKQAFERTLKSCHQYRERTVKNFAFTPDEANVFLGTAGDINYAVEKVLTEGWESGSRVLRYTGGTGMYLHELLNSYGFMLAMKRCFKNTYEENMYVGELIFIDYIVSTGYSTLNLLTVKYLLLRTWGLALLTALVATPISGSTPKEKELSIIEQMQAQLESVKAQVRELTQGPKPLK